MNFLAPLLQDTKLQVALIAAAVALLVDFVTGVGSSLRMHNFSVNYTPAFLGKVMNQIVPVALGGLTIMLGNYAIGSGVFQGGLYGLVAIWVPSIVNNLGEIFGQRYNGTFLALVQAIVAKFTPAGAVPGGVEGIVALPVAPQSAAPDAAPAPVAPAAAPVSAPAATPITTSDAPAA